MPITLKCFATLSNFQPSESNSFPIVDGETVGSVVDRLTLPRDKIHLIFVNSVRRDMNTNLTDGDILGLFPSIGGG